MRLRIVDLYPIYRARIIGFWGGKCDIDDHFLLSRNRGAGVDMECGKNRKYQKDIFRK